MTARMGGGGLAGGKGWTGCYSRRVWGERRVLLLMWSFCLSRIFLLITVSPCPGRDFISFQTRKETKQRNAFQTANT